MLFPAGRKEPVYFLICVLLFHLYGISYIYVFFCFFLSQVKHIKFWAFTEATYLANI